ncbi:uncharacterized protein N7473_011787 [Penicillium subrubescens]|uniref:uncharacterized protein n=1 Tax=Penicillium subrubescens TaxID=1316194 RepID=UPI0025450160|nr:uncharacterized protein N7473_011787 [Penicillium subrubescens]KAJ5880734.1 hypothetical protein N7473_011787 [Penicillium subrubescens]
MFSAASESQPLIKSPWKLYAFPLDNRSGASPDQPSGRTSDVSKADREPQLGDAFSSHQGIGSRSPATRGWSARSPGLSG